MWYPKKGIYLLSILSSSIFSCGTEPTINQEYKTENVIILVMDGPRYSETWGDPSHEFIPRLANDLASHGNIYTQFYNNGSTATVPGHTAIMTGVYQAIDNGGNELPQNPSIFQYWRQQSSNNELTAWVIASKDKLEVLSDCQDSAWVGNFKPSTDCGINGLGSGYRQDSITYKNTIDILTNHHPQLVLINFREPDYSGHTGNWHKYVEGIRNTDEYIYKIWQFIGSDPIYKNKTTLFITNDHGRHHDGVANGFMSHGDTCEGCRHINLYAYGPDFKQGLIINIQREQIDIPATIGELLSLNMPTVEGEVMTELFK